MEQIKGIVLPSPTVFLEDGRVHEKLMRELTEWFIACGVDASERSRQGEERLADLKGVSRSHEH